MKFNFLFLCGLYCCLTHSRKSQSQQVVTSSWWGGQVTSAVWKVIVKAKMGSCETLDSTRFIINVFDSRVWVSANLGVNKTIIWEHMDCWKTVFCCCLTQTKILSCFFTTFSKTDQASMRGQIQAYWLITNTQSLTNLLTAGTLKNIVLSK